MNDAERIFTADYEITIIITQYTGQSFDSLVTESIMLLQIESLMFRAV